MTQPLTIRQFLDDVYCLERDLSDATITHHVYSIKSLARFLGREPLLSDLTERTVNGWLLHLKEIGQSDATIKTRRIDAITWWNAAFDQEPPLVPGGPRPRKIRKPKMGKRIPRAWTPDELRKLIEAADEMRGYIRSLECPRRFYFGSLFRAAYDSALRYCDLCRVEYADIERQPGGNGVFIIQQKKTGNDVLCQFSAGTLQHVERLRELSRDKVTIWPRFGRPEAHQRIVKALVKAAGVRDGTYKWFRRSSVTARERMQRGLGTLAAGHATPDIARRHYIDASQLDPIPLPPSLEPQDDFGGVTITCTFDMGRASR